MTDKNVSSKKNEDTLLNLRIPQDLLDEFKVVLKKNDETASQLIRRFIRNYIKENS